MASRNQAGSGKHAGNGTGRQSQGPGRHRAVNCACGNHYCRICYPGGNGGR